MADGTSEINNLHHIDRGYENFEAKIRALGGKIERVSPSSNSTQEGLNEARI